MRNVKCAAILAVILLVAWGCRDEGPGVVPPPPVPVGLWWGSGASGAMVEDTIPLVVFFRDSADDPIGLPRPVVSWSSSNPSVLAIVSDTLAVAIDTGFTVLSAMTSSEPIDTLDVAFEVIPRWNGRLAWVRDTSDALQPGMAFQEFPDHEVHQLPDLGHPNGGVGAPYLSSNGRWLAAIAARPGSTPGPSTVFIVDLTTGAKHAPLDSLSGNQVGPVWLPGDTMLAFLATASGLWEVFTMRPDGSQRQQRTQLRQLAPPFYDVTPNGNIVVEVGYGPASDLFEVTLDGDTVRQLSATPDYEETTASVSPDGSMIAYVATHNAEGRSQVWIMNRDGSNARRLMPDRKRISGFAPSFGANLTSTGSPSWSPDSRFVLVSWSVDGFLRSDGLVYNHLGEIYAIRVTDGLAIRLTRHPRVDSQPFFR